MCQLLAWILALLFQFERKVDSCFLFFAFRDQQRAALKFEKMASENIMHIDGFFCKRDGQTWVSRIVYIFAIRNIISFISRHSTNPSLRVCKEFQVQNQTDFKRLKPFVAYLAVNLIRRQQYFFKREDESKFRYDRF